MQNMSEEIKTIGPYTEAEYQQLKTEMAQISNHIPDSLMGYIWDNYLKVTNINEPRPCGCKSAAGLWIKAVDNIRKFIDDNDRK